MKKLIPLILVAACGSADLTQLQKTVPKDKPPPPPPAPTLTLRQALEKLQPNAFATYAYFGATGTFSTKLDTGPHATFMEATARLAIYFSGTSPTTYQFYWYPTGTMSDWSVPTYSLFVMLDGEEVKVRCVKDGVLSGVTVGRLSDRVLAVDSPRISTLGGTYFDNCDQSKVEPRYRFGVEWLPESKHLRLTKSENGVFRMYPDPYLYEYATSVAEFDLSPGLTGSRRPRGR